MLLASKELHDAAAWLRTDGRRDAGCAGLAGVTGRQYKAGRASIDRDFRQRLRLGINAMPGLVCRACCAAMHKQALLTDHAVGRHGKAAAACAGRLLLWSRPPRACRAASRPAQPRKVCQQARRARQGLLARTASPARSASKVGEPGKVFSGAQVRI